VKPHLLVWLLVLLVLLAVAAALGTRRRAGAGLNASWPLEPKSALLSEPEQRLYQRLIQALPHHRVLPQVQLLQALRFKRGAWDASIANRISQLSIDFLVVTPDTRIVAAVELDDASHAREKRQAADARKSHALKSAGIPLLRWSVEKMPDVAAIGAAFSPLLGSGPSLQ
jgi:very-short-patch-repair endonuclease